MVASLRYLDTFVKRDGSWLVGERLLYVDWTEERSLALWSVTHARSYRGQGPTRDRGRPRDGRRLCAAPRARARSRRAGDDHRAPEGRFLPPEAEGGPS